MYSTVLYIPTQSTPLRISVAVFGLISSRFSSLSPGQPEQNEKKQFSAVRAQFVQTVRHG